MPRQEPVVARGRRRTRHLRIGQCLCRDDIEWSNLVNSANTGSHVLVVQRFQPPRGQLLLNITVATLGTCHTDGYGFQRLSLPRQYTVFTTPQLGKQVCKSLHACTWTAASLLPEGCIAHLVSTVMLSALMTNQAARTLQPLSEVITSRICHSLLTDGIGADHWDDQWSLCCLQRV